MEFILQIQEIVEGPIKDLYLNINGGLPAVELPDITNNIGPQQVETWNTGSTFQDFHFSSDQEFTSSDFVDVRIDNFLNGIGTGGGGQSEGTTDTPADK